MKTTNFRTVEELNLDVNAPAVTPTKVQNDKIVRAFVALGVNPQAKSSSWLARRLKNHLQAFGLVAAPAPAVAEEPNQVVAQKPAEEAVQESATEQPEPVTGPAVVETAKAKGKKANKKE